MKIGTRTARRLRRDMTEAEQRLWRYLRNRQFEGLKFRRQVPVQSRIADFLCYEVRLIIELDGGQHGERVEEDDQRTRELESAGFTLLRFWNNDMLANTEGVLERIRQIVITAKDR